MSGYGFRLGQWTQLQPDIFMDILVDFDIGSAANISTKFWRVIPKLQKYVTNTFGA